MIGINCTPQRCHLLFSLTIIPRHSFPSSFSIYHPRFASDVATIYYRELTYFASITGHSFIAKKFSGKPLDKTLDDERAQKSRIFQLADQSDVIDRSYMSDRVCVNHIRCSMLVHGQLPAIFTDLVRQQLEGPEGGPRRARVSSAHPSSRHTGHYTISRGQGCVAHSSSSLTSRFRRRLRLQLVREALALSLPPNPEDAPLLLYRLLSPFSSSSSSSYLADGSSSCDTRGGRRLFSSLAFPRV